VYALVFCQRFVGSCRQPQQRLRLPRQTLRAQDKAKVRFFISSSRFVLSSERNGGLYYSIWNYRLSSPPTPAKYGVCVASLSLFVN